MQEPLLAPREQAQPRVKGSPNAYDPFLMRILPIGGFCAFYWFMEAMALLSTHYITFYYFLPALFFTGLLCLNTSNFFMLKQLEYKRQAAGLAEPRLLADAQPQLSTQPISLPLTIYAHPRRSRVIKVALGAIVLIPGYWSLAALPALSIPLTRMPFYLPLMTGLALLIAVSAFVIYLMISLRRTRARIVLTEQGISQYSIFGRSSTIRWQEVRLFAIHPHSLFRSSEHPDQRPMRFEVASAYEIFRWSWPSEKGTPFLSGTRPAESAAEDVQQMYAMLAVIQQQTGLPLYDLRKPL